MLPLSLSYDHRVIDGADGARFTTRLRELLGDAEWLAALVQAGGASG
jgi:pyruvate dehydrogenase E2 component (dihydrolipoamide acetyltransferase)